MAKRDEEFEQVAEVHRATIDDTRAEGIGTAPRGAETSAPAYPDETGVTALGVDEPTLSPPVNTGEVSTDPTGQFAGETAADRQEEAAVRRVLEARFPSTKGTWKEGGRIPSADDERGE